MREKVIRGGQRKEGKDAMTVNFFRPPKSTHHGKHAIKQKQIMNNASHEILKITVQVLKSVLDNTKTEPDIISAKDRQVLKAVDGGELI